VFRRVKNIKQLSLLLGKYLGNAQKR